MHRLRALAICAACLCVAPPAAATNIIANGGFESNGGAGSSTFSNWTAVTFAGAGGAWYVQTGTASPVNILPVPAPPVGGFAAMTDDSSPSSQALLASFTVPASGTLALTFQYLRNNVPGQAPDYAIPSPDTLDWDPANANQQARVDILAAAANPFDLGAAVLMNLFQTNPGDPLQDGAYQSFDSGLFTLPPGTYQLRFVEVDNLGTFNFGVDNVTLDFVAPEPGTLWISLAALLAGAADRRLRGGRASF